MRPPRVWTDRRARGMVSDRWGQGRVPPTAFSKGQTTLRIAFFDPFSGASGDMILGALVDSGLPLDDLSRELGKLRLGGYEIGAERVSQHGLVGTRVTVRVSAEQPERTWATIRQIIEMSGLSERAKDSAQQ